MSDETVYSILLVVGLFSIANGYMEWREKHFLAGVFFFAAGALISNSQSKTDQREKARNGTPKTRDLHPKKAATWLRNHKRWEITSKCHDFFLRNMTN